MKTEILKLLREAGGYVSGQQISEKFGVSRTAVWKVIRQLQDEGYQVEAVRNKGYHIVDSPDVITKEELDSLMKTRWAGQNILYYEETDSTNLRIRQAGDEGAPHGTLAVADRQTAGRGRRGHGIPGLPLRETASICQSCFARISLRLKHPCSRLSWHAVRRRASRSAWRRRAERFRRCRSNGPMTSSSAGKSLSES